MNEVSPIVNCELCRIALACVHGANRRASLNRRIQKPQARPDSPHHDSIDGLKLMKVSLNRGSVPLLVSFPHSGTFVPPELANRMTPQGRAVPDTDWFLPRLYEFVGQLGASTIQANFSRYVADPNRSTDGVNLYPGQPTPRLCPIHCFDGSPIYLPGQEPDDFEIGKRTSDYWRHYHDDLQEELLRMKHEYGLAVLFDAHSILSQVPRLFEGQLPDINIGTARGESCAPELQKEIENILNAQSVCSHIINGRFVGGHITRHYGQPKNRVHAVQLELSQLRYMDEATGDWHDKRAAETTPVLQSIVQTVLNWAQQQTS